MNQSPSDSKNYALLTALLWETCRREQHDIRGIIEQWVQLLIHKFEYRRNVPASFVRNSIEFVGPDTILPDIEFLVNPGSLSPDFWGDFGVGGEASGS